MKRILGHVLMLGLSLAAVVALAATFAGTKGSFTATRTPGTATKKDWITITYTPDPAKVTCDPIYLTQTCRDKDQTGAVIKPKDYKSGTFDHLQDDMTPGGTYVDHVVCEKDPYYNGEDAGKDTKSAGSSDGTNATATSMSDGPYYRDSSFPDGVTTITSTFEVCAICKTTGEILDCTTWSYTRTKGAANKGMITNATTAGAVSQEFKDAKKKFEKNHKNGTVCPEAVAEATPATPNLSSGGTKKTPDPIPEGAPFFVEWDIVNGSLVDVANVDWQVLVNGLPMAGGMEPQIPSFDFQTVFFELPPQPAGPMLLTLVIDPGNLIPEFDETDNIDEEVIDIFDPTSLPAGAGRSRFGLQMVMPNPTAGAFTVTFSLDTDSPANLIVLDVRGRRVMSRRITDVPAESPRTIRLEMDRGLASGVYFVRLVQGTKQDTRKVIKVH